MKQRDIPTENTKCSSALQAVFFWLPWWVRIIIIFLYIWRMWLLWFPFISKFQIYPQSCSEVHSVAFCMYLVFLSFTHFKRLSNPMKYHSCTKSFNTNFVFVAILVWICSVTFWYYNKVVLPFSLPNLFSAGSSSAT